MKVDGWFNLTRADGSQPSGYPRDYAKERRNMVVFAVLCALGLLALLVVTPPAPVVRVLLWPLVFGLIFAAIQLLRLRNRPGAGG